MCRQSHDNITRPCICCQGIICHLNMRHYATLSHKKQLTNTKFKTSKQQTNSLSISAYIVLLAPNFDYAGFLETIEEIICSDIYLC